MKKAFVIVIFSMLLSACKDSSTNSSPSSEMITANQRKSAINAYVNSYHAGLRLLSVSTTNVDTTGKASRWAYCYVDTSLGEHPTFYFHSTTSEIGFDSTATLLIGPSVITLRWFDSDSALIFSQKNGGSQYCAQYPNARIAASLFQTLSSNSDVRWRVFYQGGWLTLGLIIDANTGALLGQTR